VNAPSSLLSFIYTIQDTTRTTPQTTTRRTAPIALNNDWRWHGDGAYHLWRGNSGLQSIVYIYTYIHLLLSPPCRCGSSSRALIYIYICLYLDLDLYIPMVIPPSRAVLCRSRYVYIFLSISISPILGAALSQGRTSRARRRGGPALWGPRDVRSIVAGWRPYVLNMRSEEYNTVFYSYSARFVNTITLNMNMFLSSTGRTRQNTLFILVWLRPRNTWIPIQHVGWRRWRVCGVAIRERRWAGPGCTVTKLNGWRGGRETKGRYNWRRLNG